MGKVHLNMTSYGMVLDVSVQRYEWMGKVHLNMTSYGMLLDVSVQ
jgi:hypothetical protein